MTDAPFADLAAFVNLPRIAGLALSPDGRRLVAAVQQPDDQGSRYATALWEVPLDGAGEPIRLTRSLNGETAPVFLPDGRLLFGSTRPDPGGADDDATVWALPVSGEPEVLVRRRGGVSVAGVAQRSGAVLLSAGRLVGSSDADDAERRDTRRDRKINAILHTGMPIRLWDHELGYQSDRLLLLDPGATEPRDLAPDVQFELLDTEASISADGAVVAARWTTRQPHGRTRGALALIDTADGARRILPASEGWEYGGPVVSPDGARVALRAERQPSFTVPWAIRLEVLDAATGAAVLVDAGDLNPSSWVWSTDGATLYVTGDRHGRGAVLAVDPLTGTARRRLVGDAVYGALQPAPDGLLYALRTAVDSAPTPVVLDPSTTDQEPRRLPTPAPSPAVPGRLVELDVPAGDVTVHGWLCLPPESGRPESGPPESGPPAQPAPVMLWIHGGPLGSHNAWSWRWNPWTAVAQGWAVVLPDPTLSTGYGQGCIDRGWPYLADVVWAECQAVLDAALERPELDGSRTACLGGSFGGFMTNWIAGHTDRFGAIVTHAGLWALDQQHATTDAAEYKTAVFDTPAEHPEWYAKYSPHHFLDRISTPMLVCHGNRDYRVPVSEALRLWWDLVSSWDGAPEELPHRFLQFTAENHWILSPANSQIWYETVLGFCGQHVLGRAWTPSELL